MSDIMDFGFEDGKVIKTQGIDQFKLSRSGEKSAFSVISFKRYHDVALAAKQKERGSAYSEEEKAELFRTVDAKLADKLSKKVEDLTEVDRLEVRSPRFWFAFTHYRDGIGTIRCLSKYQGAQIIKPELCCEQMGDADQTVGAVVLKYPVDKDGNVDMDLFKLRKYTEVQVIKMASKKFKKLESTYTDAKKHNFPVIDIKVEMEGEPKYQKFIFTNGYTAAWMQEGVPDELRHWVLDQGLRAQKHVKTVLGFEMKKEVLAEKLRGELPSGNAEVSAPKPQLQKGYDSLLGS